jgi:hypothetical protein
MWAKEILENFEKLGGAGEMNCELRTELLLPV